MEVDQKVIAEPVGKTEGDWSSGIRSTAGLPPFVEGEFKRLVDAKNDPTPEAEPGATQDEKADLKAHMGALLGEGSGESNEEDEQGNPDADADATETESGRG